jgi:hypothetical protein
MRGSQIYTGIFFFSGRVRIQASWQGGILKVGMWGADTCFSRLGYLVAAVSSTLSEREVPPAIAQRIIVKFLTNEGVKPSKILTRLRAQCGNMTL